jgi:hypothetical protein
MSTKQPGPADLSKLFATQGVSLGLTPQGSSVLINNLNGTVAPMCVGGPLTPDEQETDDFRLVFFVFDGSGSMDVVENEFRECVNEVLIPGILEGAASQVGAIRYNGVVFRERVYPLWPGNLGWKRLKDEKLELTPTEYWASGSTSLNQAVLDAVTATGAYALQLMQKTGSYPKCTIAVLSDGANNQPPMDASQVRVVVDGLSVELFDLMFLGFETAERVDFRQVARDLGFREIQESKLQPGEDRAALRRRLRHAMQIFSQSITGSVSKGRVGGSSGSKTGGSGRVSGGSGSSGGLWNP